MIAVPILEGCYEVYSQHCNSCQKPHQMQPIFSRNEDYMKTSFMNWRTSPNNEIGNMLAMAEGYLTAAIELTKTCLKDNQDKKADIFIFPILTNANHGIELYLKVLVWVLNILTNKERKIEGKHNIKQILETVKSRIKEYKGQTFLDSFNQRTESLQMYVSELYQKIGATAKDDKMDFSRYPITTGYENHFYADELQNVEVDMPNLLLRFEQILDSLDDIVSYYYYQEFRQEW